MEKNIPKSAWCLTQRYLRDVLTRITDTPMSQLDQFLLDRWRAARQTTVAAN